MGSYVAKRKGLYGQGRESEDEDEDEGSVKMQKYPRLWVSVEAKEEGEKGD